MTLFPKMEIEPILKCKLDYLLHFLNSAEALLPTIKSTERRPQPKQSPWTPILGVARCTCTRGPKSALPTQALSPAEPRAVLELHGLEAGWVRKRDAARSTPPRPWSALGKGRSFPLSGAGCRLWEEPRPGTRREAGACSHPLPGVASPPAGASDPWFLLYSSQKRTD